MRAAPGGVQTRDDLLGRIDERARTHRDEAAGSVDDERELVVVAERVGTHLDRVALVPGDQQIDRARMGNREQLRERGIGAAQADAAGVGVDTMRHRWPRS